LRLLNCEAGDLRGEHLQRSKRCRKPLRGWVWGFTDGVKLKAPR
jgi:hypothetical protein